MWDVIVGEGDFDSDQFTRDLGNSYFFLSRH